VRHLVAEAFGAVLRNAAEAAGPEGEVRVSLRPTRAGVLVSVQDSGPGIRPEHLPRIFDPFFTTKPVGAGRGMGLALAYGILRSLGGRIEAASEPGAGATFRLWLPRRPPGVDGHELSPVAAN
jgi:signal transduction histidine kinase